MKVFLTGGSGFLGRAIVRRLRQDGHEVLGLARSESSADTLRAAGAEPIAGDLSDLVDSDGAPSEPAWSTVLAGVDAVVHAAAYMEFWGPDALFVRANHRPTVALYDAAVRAHVPRFTLISAASVSSGSERSPLVGESTPEGKPNLAYSRVKLATERALREAPSGQTTLVVLRPPFVWGRGMPRLDDMVSVARAGQFAWIDRGRHVADAVHVDNLADAVVLSISHGRPGGVYYVTDGAPMPIKEFLTPLLATRGVDLENSRSFPLPVAAAVAAVMDRTARVLRRPTAPPLTNWLVSFTGRDRSYDIGAARTELGYSPKVTFAEGVALMRDEPARPPRVP